MSRSKHFLLVMAALLGSTGSVADIDGPALEARIEAGEAKSVLEQMEAALESDPPSAEAHFWLARAQLAQIDEASVFRKMGLARDARENLEAAIALDGRFVPARVALGQFYLQAPAIAGGSEDKAMAQVEALMGINAGSAYRLRADIARARGDQNAALSDGRRALTEGPWTWAEQYRLVVEGVHGQADDAALILDDAEENVRLHGESTADYLRLLDYQRGKLAATTGTALDAGEAALTRYLSHEPEEGEPGLEWAEFRLAQVERQQGLLKEADRRLATLERREVPDDLGFALQDERRWHYSD